MNLFFNLGLLPAVPAGRQQPKQPLLQLDEVVVVIQGIIQVQLSPNFDVIEHLLIQFSFFFIYIKIG
jgi:hypothetical protein